MAEQSDDRVWRAWAGPSERLRRITFWVAIAFVVLFLGSAAVPGGPYDLGPILVLLGLATLGCWFFWSQSGMWTWTPRLRRWLVPLMVVGSFALTALNVPAWLGFTLDRHALVEATHHPAPPTTKGQWVGFYYMPAASVSEVGAEFYTNKEQTAGFVYNTDGVLPATYRRHYHALGGGWYSFDEGW